jgi:hypothetical protein
MRTILILTALFFEFTFNLFAQTDFPTLDKQTYDYYIMGDYKNLKITGNKMLSHGIDYYNLRMRMGILAYNHQQYPSAVKHFTKALEFNSFDSISREYIYYSYLFSGRKDDANHYLASIPLAKRNKTLKSIESTGLSNVFLSSSTAGYDEVLYSTNNLYYEALKNSLSISAGLENYFTTRLKGTLAYTSYHKTGIEYSNSSPLGTNLNFSQNQIYANLTQLTFPGWEFSGFGHFAFYSEANNQSGMGRQKSKITSEYIGGIGISKNWWRIRAGANVSYSNFGKSNQLRGEGYLTYLPFGNLNLYLTSGVMYQNDNEWGATYQINQEIGFKTLKFLWLESGIVKGNSFLYARNQGLIMNNSYQIPTINMYENLIFLLGHHFDLTATAYYIKNNMYSWDLNTFNRTSKQLVNSFGGSIKLTYKFK